MKSFFNIRQFTLKHHIAGQLAIVALLSTPIVQAADDTDPGSQLSSALTDTSAWSWLESRRDTVSRNVSDIGSYIDDWLAGDTVGEYSNESYLRLQINQQVSGAGNYHSNLRLSGRVDLPRASERWKLIFESEQTELDSLQNKRLSNVRPQSFTGGFSYEMPRRANGLRFNHDVGVKARIPLDPFYRFRTRYNRQLNEKWLFGADNRILYYHTDGWGQESRIYFSRELSDNMFLRVDTDVDYWKKDKGFEFAQTVSVHQTLGERETLTYEGGVIGVSQPTQRVESYYAQTVYRKAIYKDWLVMELVPQLVMERNEDWDPDPRFQFNLQVYFFEF